MKTKTLLVAVIAATLFTACGSKKGTHDTAGSQEYELMFNLPKGKVYNMQMNMATEVGVTLMGQTMNSNNTTEMTLDYEVKDVLPNGNYIIRTTIKKIKISESGMGSNASYDSETGKATGANAEEFAAQQKEKLGKWIEMEMDKYGKNMKTTYSDTTHSKGGGVLDGFNFTVFPDKKIKIGDTWTSNTNQKMKDVELIIKSTYSLLSVNGGIAETNLDGTIAIDMEPGKTNSTLSGTQKGNIKIDMATGITKEATIVQEMDMEINDNEVKMPMKMKNTLTIRMN